MRRLLPDRQENVLLVLPALNVDRATAKDGLDILEASLRVAGGRKSKRLRRASLVAAHVLDSVLSGDSLGDTASLAGRRARGCAPRKRAGSMNVA